MINYITNYLSRALSGLALIGLVGTAVPQYARAEESSSPTASLASKEICLEQHLDEKLLTEEKAGQTCLSDLDAFLQKYDGQQVPLYSVAKQKLVQEAVGKKDRKVTPHEYGLYWINRLVYNNGPEKIDELEYSWNINISMRYIAAKGMAKEMIPYLDINQDGVVSEQDDIDGDNMITAEDAQLYSERQKQQSTKQLNKKHKKLKKPQKN